MTLHLRKDIFKQLQSRARHQRINKLGRIHVKAELRAKYLVLTPANDCYLGNSGVDFTNQ
jgi:hypothetical protein